MCELGVFPNVLENDLLKVDRIQGLTFYRAVTEVCARCDCLQLPYIRVEEAVL